MRQLKYLLVVLGLILPGMAFAHGPSRQKVTVTAEVAADPAEVWSVIGNFHDMSWHPAVFETQGEGGNDLESVRVLVLGEAGGPTITESLYKYDADKMSYSYYIDDVAVEVLPVTNYSSHLTVKPRDGGGSLIEWRGAFYRGYPNNDPPAELNDEAAIAGVTAIYDAGMAALVERFGAP
ncbi:hypothetical protein P775_04735 [Puniceibacterium antarcticum]|uniref:Uncharacterized protein n=1 Tax=Puniceibacterium antarcticum TaxID=1206336 RepID=A0A2G8RIA2_9RHOB|nr:SRPBCC family protein [Puniceibacterium antarcticum]PIL21297.1 hypothetical protein P775_04735 [Puniceibacterium antarcticum]